MNKQELDYVTGFVEEKFTNIPPQGIWEIKEFLEDSEFSKEQAMGVIVVAVRCAPKVDPV